MQDSLCQILHITRIMGEFIMRLFDPKFKNNIRRYVLQCVLAMLIIFIVLFITDTIFNMTVVASLGASTFIALTMPHTNSSRPRYLIGGYVIGILCGILMNYVTFRLTSTGLTVFEHSPHIITCALAVGLAILLMTACNFEHPPAAALAMGLVLDANVLITSFAAFISIIIISLIKILLKKWLKDLL